MNSHAKKKVLVLVEGEKTDVAVMRKLFEVYSELDAKYQIVSYRTNIYLLYKEFFANNEDQEAFDLLQVLKSRETDYEKKKIFDEKYTDTLLIFDLDPQDGEFTEEKIRKMQAYFCESSDMGKLYLNYPMIEAYYHMSTIPDHEYKNRIVRMDELVKRKYKERVRQESRGHDYRKFILNRADSNYVILENIRKALAVIESNFDPTKEWHDIDLSAVLEKQLGFLQAGYLQVLCTCVMYIYDYSHELLLQD